MKNISQNKKTNIRGWYIVLISAFMGCTISASFPQFSMTVAELAEKMDVSAQLLLTGDTVKSAGIVIAMLVSGFAYKKLGARKTFIMSLFFTILPQILLPFITSIPLFMVLKFVQGLTSIIFPIFLLIIMDWIDESQTGLATAIFNGIFYGGGGIGGTFAGFFIAEKGWVSSYYAVAVLELAVGILWLLTVKEKAPQPSPLSASQEEPKEGLSPIKLLRMPKVWLLILSFFSTTFVLQAITVDMPVFSAYLGYDDIRTGSIMTAVTIGMIASCLLSGKISDFFAARTENKARARIAVLMAGPVIIILSTALLILSNVGSFSVFYGCVLFFSFGAAWGLGTFYSILPEMFDDETLPLVTGFSGGVGDLGMPAAPMVVGVAFGAGGLWNLGWASCAVLAAISILSCIVLCRTVKQRAN